VSSKVTHTLLGRVNSLLGRETRVGQSFQAGWPRSVCGQMWTQPAHAPTRVQSAALKKYRKWRTRKALNLRLRHQMCAYTDNFRRYSQRHCARHLSLLFHDVDNTLPFSNHDYFQHLFDHSAQ